MSSPLSGAPQETPASVALLPASAMGACHANCSQVLANANNSTSARSERGAWRMRLAAECMVEVLARSNGGALFGARLLLPSDARQAGVVACPLSGMATWLYFAAPESHAFSRTRTDVTATNTTRTAKTLALLGWLLLALQSPWHVGMQAGRALQSTAALPELCGGPLSASAIVQLRAAGQWPENSSVSTPGKSSTHAFNLCDFFAGVQAHQAPVIVAAAVVPASVPAIAILPLVSSPASSFLRPQPRAPPFLA
jgi:hypothetical protein